VATSANPQVRLLGPVDVLVDGEAAPVAGARRKALLAALALHAGHTVSVDSLIDAVWSGDAPATAANTLQSHVSFLRGVLRSRPAIVAAPPGYRLDLGPDGTDLQVAQRLIAQAARAAEPAERLAPLRMALGLWRSRSLADLIEIPWFDGQAERLERLRADAVSALVDARLALGEHAALVPELAELVRARPFDEALHSQLMLALYRSGRQADALEVHRELRERLADQLGIDPGRAIRDLETAMLRQDPSLDAPGTLVTVGSPAMEPGVVPAQLPPTLPYLVGREAEMAALDWALEPTAGATGPMICAVSGAPGVGKTSLAVAWAHRVAHRFPDGQLYINLRGFDPRADPIDPAQALHGFLEALGLSPQRIPEGSAARMGLYRSLLADRRCLVVLDNAHDADHVRPLLPGGSGCVTVITSRNKLTSLVANEGALALPIDVLPRDAAHAFLARRIGEKRIAGEPDAVDDIIGRCAGLPLALSIVAARAATEPAVSLATMADQMLAATNALDSLAGGDHSADVRAVISWSYEVLSPGAATLLRQLALHPGTEIGVHAAASLAALPLSRARRTLSELTAASLLIALSGERYTFHDLIRAYALEQALEIDSEGERRIVLERLLDHYLHSAQAAAGRLDVYRDEIPLTAPAAGVRPEAMADHEQALEWLLTEYRTLLSLIGLAGTNDFDAHAWKLAGILTEFFERRGLWLDWLAANAEALRSAGRLDDKQALAFSHRSLGRAHHWLGDFTESDVHHRQALAYFAELGDSLGQARVWHSLGRLAELRGDMEQALEYTQNGLELFRAVNDRPGIAKALNGVGWYHCLLGDYREALKYCGEALVLLQALGDRRVEANTWDSLGYAHHKAGDFTRAIECYQQALTLFRDMGDRVHEADASAHLGDAYAATGDRETAAATWRQALEILEDLGHADAVIVRDKIAAALAQVGG
jgi:DNA-binding SARP family transcriptional activator